jgi:hypothetical protein
MASIPDGTATGGNARGTNAVDFQLTRNFALMVASGNYSTILGGQFNRATADYSFVGNGNQNQATGQFAAVVSGYFNNSSGTNSFIGGGQSNTNSSNFGTISGGQSNTASTNTHATVVGGQSNTASGTWSIAGGGNCNATNNYAVAFGNGSTASGNWSLAIGRGHSVSGTGAAALNDTNTSAGTAGLAVNWRSSAYLQGQLSSAAGLFTSNGDAQQSNLTARRQSDLTTAATTVLSLDGTGTTNLIIPSGNNRAWHTTIDTIATVTTISGSATGVTVGDSFMQTDKLLFKRIGGTSSIVGKSTVETIYDTSMSTAAMLYTAGSSQQLAITFQAPTFSGGGSITCRVVSKVSLVEVAY